MLTSWSLPTLASGLTLASLPVDLGKVVFGKLYTALVLQQYKSMLLSEARESSWKNHKGHGSEYQGYY